MMATQVQVRSVRADIRAVNHTIGVDRFFASLAVCIGADICVVYHTIGVDR